MRMVLLSFCCLILILSSGFPVLAQYDFPTTLLGTGEDEREDGAEGCLSEPDFLAGLFSEEAQLRVAGESAGCDSEWGAFAEFDFNGLQPASVILSATLHLRYTGYGDDISGLPYLGVYGYVPTAGGVILPRDDLNDHTALDIFALSGTTNVDIALDVTGYVSALVQQEIQQAGFFVCGIFSEAGYSTLVYFGGSTHLHPPELIISTVSPVANGASSWGAVKSLYR